MHLDDLLRYFSTLNLTSLTNQTFAKVIELHFAIFFYIKSSMLIFYNLVMSVIFVDAIFVGNYQSKSLFL